MQEMDIVVAIVSILISSLVSVTLAHLGMNRKLEKILQREYVGKLNKAQALDLLKLYLAEMRRELNREIDEFCTSRLNAILEDQDTSSVSVRIELTLETRYMKIQELVSNKFSRFKLENSVSFIDLMNNINRDMAEETYKKIVKDIIQHFPDIPLKEDIPDTKLQAIKENMSAEMVKANKKGKELFEQQLKIIYTKT